MNAAAPTSPVGLVQSPDSYLNEMASRTRKFTTPPIADRDVLPDHLRDAQVAHGLGGRLDSLARGRLP